MKAATVFLRSNEVARLLGVTKRTLQLWVRNGRIPVPERSAAGYYLWSAADLCGLKALPTQKRGPRAGGAGRRDAA